MKFFRRRKNVALSLENSKGSTFAETATLRVVRRRVEGYLGRYGNRLTIAENEWNLDSSDRRPVEDAQNG